MPLQIRNNEIIFFDRDDFADIEITKARKAWPSGWRAEITIHNTKRRIVGHLRSMPMGRLWAWRRRTMLKRATAN